MLIKDVMFWAVVAAVVVAVVAVVVVAIWEGEISEYMPSLGVASPEQS